MKGKSHHHPMTRDKILIIILLRTVNLEVKYPVEFESELERNFSTNQDPC